MQIHKKKLSSQLIGAALFGVFINLASMVFMANVMYLREYGKQGLSLMMDELILPPTQFLGVLFIGPSGENSIHELMHRVYTDLNIQVFYWILFFSFILLSITKKKILVKRDASDYGSHGSAKWGTSVEIKEALQKDKIGFVLGEYKKKMAVLPLNNSLNNNVSVFGGAGSGKSAGFSVVNILHNAMSVGESMVITDPKGELYNTTVPSLRDYGYDVLVFNLLDMKKSMRYNPMDVVHNMNDAMSLAEMIVSNSGGMSKDPMWSNAEIAYFASLIMYLKEMRPKEEHHIKSVLRFGTRLGSDEEAMDEMFFALPEDSEALEMYHIFRNAKDKTRAGILIGFGVRLKLWVSNDVAKLTSESDFDLKQLGNKKTALFLLMPDSDTTFDIIPAILIDQMFKQLYEEAGKNESLSLNISVRCILDELANIARINDFEVKVSTMRSRGIAVVPIFQSLTQFKNRYDHDRWAEILSSSDTIVFLGTNDKDTAKYFSDKLGPGTYLVNSVSEGERSSSTNHNFIGRPLMTPDEVERLSDDELIVFQKGKNPMRIQKHWYFKQRRWKDIVKTQWSEDIMERTNDRLKIYNPNISEPVIPEPVISAGGPLESEIEEPNVNVTTGEIINETNSESESEDLLPDFGGEENITDNIEESMDEDYIAALLNEEPPDTEF